MAQCKKFENIKCREGYEFVDILLPQKQGKLTPAKMTDITVIFLGEVQSQLWPLSVVLSF
jgi:hypothetical protein